MTGIYVSDFDDPMDLDRSGRIYCGKSDCQIRDILIKTDVDQYRFLKENYTLVKNGTTITTWDDIEEQVSSSEESLTPVISETEIYNYMENEFNKITNYGESYNPETHDPIISKMAADKFGVSESEANQIYIDYVMDRWNK